MSDEQLHKARANFLDDPIAAAMFVTLADTGAKVSEISGLRVKDCDVGQRGPIAQYQLLINDRGASEKWGVPVYYTGPLWGRFGLI